MNILKPTKAEKVKLEIYKMVIRKAWRQSAIDRGINYEWVEKCFDSGWDAVFDAVKIIRSR